MDDRFYPDGGTNKNNKGAADNNSYYSAEKNNSRNTNEAQGRKSGRFEVNIPEKERSIPSPSEGQRPAPTSGSAVNRRAPASNSAANRRAPAQGAQQRRAPAANRSRAAQNSSASVQKRNTSKAQLPDKKSDKVAEKHKLRYEKATKKYEKALSKGKVGSEASVEDFMLSKSKRKKLEKKREKELSARKLTPEQIKKRKMRKRYNFVKGLLITCVCLIFITIITVSVSTIALSVINDILVIDKSNSYSVSVVIPEEATKYDEVYEILCNSGLVKQKFLTDFFCRYRHYDSINVKNDDGKYETVYIEYEPGIYYFDSTDGIEAILETIMIKDSYDQDTIRLTFPEGWSIAQVFEKIEKYEVCEAQKLYANLEIIGAQYDFIEDITVVEGRYLKAEGYLFPDTYDFYIGENASSVLKKLFNNFSAKWTKEYTKKAKALGMSMDEIIKIASIIQREAKDKSQMGDISSVIHNRLKDPATYPNLEMNSTKDYITSLDKYDLFSDFYYQLYIDTYNTYSSEGLPPGAICNPGIDAIEAALEPNDTPYFFFCHDTSGNIYLSVTSDEHDRNVQNVLYGIEDDSDG